MPDTELATAGAWFPAHFAESTASTDLAAAYGFPHPLNHARRLRCSVLPPPIAKLSWLAQFKDTTDQPVLQHDLERTVRASAPLWSANRSGPVVMNLRFAVRELFRSQGFASAVYSAEENLFRYWGIAEVQLIASGLGPRIWVKRFGFQPRDLARLRRRYTTWAERSRVGSPFPENLRELPDAFLDEQQRLELFKTITPA